MPTVTGSTSASSLRKLPEIDQLIDRATTVQQLLQFCGGCRCKSIDECRLLDERTKLLDHRALQPVSRAAELDQSHT